MNLSSYIAPFWPVYPTGSMFADRVPRGARRVRLVGRYSVKRCTHSNTYVQAHAVRTIYAGALIHWLGTRSIMHRSNQLYLRPNTVLLM